MSFTPTEKHGEGRTVELLLELLHRGHGDRVLLSQDVCHNSQLRQYEGNGYTYLQTTFLPRLREAGVSAGGDRPADGREPAPDPDDRVGRPGGRDAGDAGNTRPGDVGVTRPGAGHGCGETPAGAGVSFLATGRATRRAWRPPTARRCP